MFWTEKTFTGYRLLLVTALALGSFQVSAVPLQSPGSAGALSLELPPDQGREVWQEQALRQQQRETRQDRTWNIGDGQRDLPYGAGYEARQRWNASHAASGGARGNAIRQIPAARGRR